MSKSSIASQSSPRWTTQARSVAVMAAAALFSLGAASLAIAQGAPLKLPLPQRQREAAQAAPTAKSAVLEPAA